MAKGAKRYPNVCLMKLDTNIRGSLSMAFLKKTFTSGLFIGFFIGIVSLVAIFAGGILYFRDNPEGGIAQWGKAQTKLFLNEYHPISRLRSYAHEVKSNMNTPSALAHSTFSFQKVGFSGSRVEQSGSILTWISPFSDRIPPDRVPPQNKIKEPGQDRPVNIIGLRGETLSFQVVLRSSHPMDNITLSIAKIEGTGADCIRIHRFLEIYMKVMVRQGNKHGPLKELINPDPLIPFTDPYSPRHVLISQFKLKKNQNQPVWIDVHFSRSCLPKTYIGQLELRSSGTIIRKIPLSLDVLSATLPQDVGLDRWMELYMTRFWRGEMIQNDLSFQTLLHRYFQFAHQYGFVTNDCGSISPKINWDWNTGKPISVDWSYYDMVNGPELSGNLTGRTPHAWCLPVPERSLGVNNWGGFTTRNPNPSPIDNWEGIPDIATQNLAKLIVQHWKDKNWPISHAFVYTFDEPAHLLSYPDIYKLIGDVATSLHKGSDDKLRFMLTDTPWTWGKEQKNHDKSAMYDKIDIWAPNAATYIPDRIIPYQKKGKRAWFYQGGPPFIAIGELSSTGIGFRMWFWTAWKYRVNGVFYWASDFWKGDTMATNPYTNGGSGDGEIFYPGHQLHFLGYPDIDGPVPSIRVSQWRRGYEDYKYFYMLKQKKHGKDADAAVNSIVKHALDDGGYIPYWRNPLWWKPGDWNHDPTVWHRIRVSLAKEIEKLYSSSN